MIAIDPVTLSEAQFLLERPEKDLNRAIDRGEIDKITETVSVPATRKAAARRRTGAPAKRRKSQSRVMGRVAPPTTVKTVRKLGAPELLFLSIERQVHDDLTPAGRRKLYLAIKTQTPDARKIKLGPFEADLAKAARELTTRYKKLRDLRSGIVEHAQGDPVIKGTEISAYRVAALAQAQRVEDVMADYPSLSTEQVQRAIDYATAYPKPGRPYPAQSFRRAAGALADLGAFDPVADDEAEA